MKRQTLFGAALLLGALAAPPAWAADHYGAIAFSTGSGALGWAYDYGSRGEAEDEAVSQCGGGCSAVLWFRNACGAIATSSDHSYGTGWASSRGEAESIALNGCRKHADDCGVQRWVCTTR
jgi:serine/threonine-protein kinase